MTNETALDQNGPDSSGAKLFTVLLQPDFTSRLEEWAGEKIFRRGEAYFKKKLAGNLAMTPQGKLLGDVQGARHYIAALYLDENGRLAGKCACPYNGVCKHIVALGLTGQEVLLENKMPPLCQETDFRPEELFPDEAMPLASMGALRKNLANLPKEVLVDLLLKACELDNNILLLCAAQADPDKIGFQIMLNDARKAIAKAAASPDFEDEYSSAANYAAIAKKLRAIIAAGKAAEALKLAEQVFSSCSSVIETLDHDGEVIGDVAQLSEAAMQALQVIDWPAENKLIWAIKNLLQDGFGYCDVFETFLDEMTDAQAWTKAQEFLEALRQNISNSWIKSRITRLLKLALKKTGQNDELLRIYEAEAQENGRYLQLVNYLLEQKDHANAEKWICKGLKKSRYPYETTALREKLIDMREKEGNLDAVIALRTELFVDSPKVDEYEACARSAKATGKWEALKPLLIAYLTDGKLPWREKGWPCENKGSIEAAAKKFPLCRELAELAIHENRPLDALKWHDLQRKNKRSFGISETRLADAIKDVAPERAFAIWQKEVEKLIGEINSGSYYQAGEYLEKMLVQAEKLGDKNRWLPYLHSLREKHKRKKNFLKVLDAVERGEKLSAKVFH